MRRVQVPQDAMIQLSARALRNPQVGIVLNESFDAVFFPAAYRAVLRVLFLSAVALLASTASGPVVASDPNDSSDGASARGRDGRDRLPRGCQ